MQTTVFKKSFLAHVPERFRLPESIEIKCPVVKVAAVDWLTISASQPMENTGPGDDPQPKFFKAEFRGEYQKGDFAVVSNSNMRDRVYSKAFDVYYMGSLFGILFCCPYSAGVKSPDSVAFKVNNEWLYAEWTQPLYQFLKSFNLQLQGVSRLDIALDGIGFLDPMRYADMKAVRLKGKTNLSRWSRGNQKITGFLLGSKASDRYVRCYHKNNEIEQSSKKYYVQKFWSNNGISEDQFAEMERLETVFKAAELKKIISDPVLRKQFPGSTTWKFIANLADPVFLQALAKTAIDDLYVFTEQPETEKTNVSRLRKVCEVIYGATCRKIKRVGEKNAARIRATQQAIKVVYQLYLKTKAERFRYLAGELIQECELETWWKKRKPKIIYEYELAVKNERPFYPLFSGKNLDLTKMPRLTRPYVEIDLHYAG